MFPTEECMTNRERLEEFVANASLDLTSIAVDERKGTLEWVLKHCAPMLKSLKVTALQSYKEVMTQVEMVFWLFSYLRLIG